MKFFLLLLILFFCRPAHATADGPDCWNVKGVAPGDMLNIRARPNMQSKVIGRIPPKARGLDNVTDEYPDSDTAPYPYPGWCKIGYKGIIGWVACRFLTDSVECN